MPALFGGYDMPPQVEIGLTDLPKYGTPRDNNPDTRATSEYCAYKKSSLNTSFLFVKQEWYKFDSWWFRINSVSFRIFRGLLFKKKLKVRQSRNNFFKFSVVFWRKLKTPKRHFEINWHLLKKFFKYGKLSALKVSFDIR